MITYIETHVNGTQLLGSDMTSVLHNCNTQRKLHNAYKRHIARIKNLTNIHPELKQGFEIKHTTK